MTDRDRLETARWAQARLYVVLIQSWARPLVRRLNSILTETATRRRTPLPPTPQEPV